MIGNMITPSITRSRKEDICTDPSNTDTKLFRLWSSMETITEFSSIMAQEKHIPPRKLKPIYSQQHHNPTQTWRIINEIGREKIDRKWSPEKNNEFTTIAALFPKRLTMRLHKYCRNSSSSDIGVITAELRSESERLPRGGNSTSNRQGARK